MDPHEDAYGRAMRAHLDGEESFEIVERDDGYFGVSGGPELYFAGYDAWPARQRDAVEHVRGRVLDVGCGAGRHALYLQERGFDVLGIDVSPLAVEVCRERGLADVRALPVEDVDTLDGEFDTVLMLGNNFGLVGTAETAPAVLRTLAAVTSPDATLVAESTDPRATDDPDHLAYHEFNEARGRLAGALRTRVRFKRYATDWFDYLLASREEMEAIVDGTVWRVGEVIDGEDGAYVGLLGKA